HERSVAARAEREAERVEHDRLPRARLAGQHRKPRREVEVQFIDQDDVAYREVNEHESPESISGGPASCKPCGNPVQPPAFVIPGRAIARARNPDTPVFMD